MLVVTAATGERVSGCLVGFHSQCSIAPLRYLVLISVTNRTYRVAERAEHLGVHLLASDQHWLAELFGGQTSDEIDKLGHCAWDAGAGGAPLLEDVVHRFVGRIVDRVPVGDHVGFVLDPVEAHGTGELTPLGFRDVLDIEPGHAP